MACTVGSIVGAMVSATVGKAVTAFEVGFRLGRLDGLTGDCEGFLDGLVVICKELIFVGIVVIGIGELVGFIEDIIG